MRHLFLVRASGAKVAQLPSTGFSGSFCLIENLNDQFSEEELGLEYKTIHLAHGTNIFNGLTERNLFQVK